MATTYLKRGARKARALLAVLVALALALGLAPWAAQPAHAASDGSITISNATSGQTYEVYKLFDATYSGDNVSYTITATSDNSALISTLQGEGTVFTLTPSAGDSSVYVVALKSDYAKDADDKDITATDDQVIAFVKSIAEKLGDAVKTEKATATTVTFSGLDYGYYYITSTLGTLVTIDSAIPSVEIVDKNTAPKNDKDVQEDSDSSWGDSNTADLGQTVNFKSTITAYAGAEGYVLHDTMSTGLTFNSTSVSVTEGTGDSAKTLTAYTEGATSWDYKVVTPGMETGEGVTACTFEVVFNQTYLNTITGTTENPTTIVVSYSATVNENAVIGNDGNSNTSSLDYGEQGSTVTTPASTTETYVYAFDLLKYSGTDEDDNKITLDGAEFTLTRKDETTALYFVKSTKTVDEETVTVYTLADSTAEGASQTITAGKITIEGLDAGEYTMTETRAPDGYNLLDKSITVVIGQSTENDTTTMTLTQDGTTVNEIEVLNQSGTELPATGGIGTTLFYLIGGILVVGAGAALIVRKRKANAKH